MTMMMMMKRRLFLVLAAALMCATGAEADAHCSKEIEVEVHAPMDTAAVTQADVDAWVAKKHKTGQFRDCPAETVYHEFHKDVYGGYKGCAGDVSLVPCAQDGFGGSLGGFDDPADPKMMKSVLEGGMNKPFEFDEATATCKETNRTFADEIFWILWGYPMDNHELLKRTGMNPVVYFPLERSSYPQYNWDSHGNEAMDAVANDRDWMAYIGFMDKTESAKFNMMLTEGTEAGMGMLYASMMIHIARTSCNRALYLAVEAPTYGYDYNAAVRLANTKASSFYNSSECSCFATDSCKSGTITMTRVGYFPSQALPKAKGDDGLEYDASSTDAKSPWFERMVWPENPTGETRKQAGPADRLVCDGCYVFPQYFPGGVVPGADKPSCAGWAFSLTKSYSATIRVGTALVLKDHPISDAMVDVAKTVHSLANGDVSEWTWKGMIQIKNLIMAKPVSDPTSWLGAYNVLMDEKWKVMADALGKCSGSLELLNGPAKTGAYLWIRKLGDMRCLNTAGDDKFFLHSLGVKTTTYYFGFRGTTASDGYGEGQCNRDFTRIQLYRDLSVYQQVAKRIETVCGGGAVSHAMGTMMSMEEWKTSMKARRRRLEETGRQPHEDTVEDRMQQLMEAIPRLTEKEAKFHAEHDHIADEVTRKIEEECEPIGYPMDCLFKHTGKKGQKDIKID